MEVKINIKDEDIVDALCTAIESGTDYWRVFKNSKKLVPIVDDEPRAITLINFVMNGGVLEVYDVEEGDYLGEFSLDNIKRGVELYLMDNRAFDAAMDADDADVLFQFIVMGEIVYG